MTGDIYDGTRRKVARHVTRNVADDILRSKHKEFTEKAMQVASEMMTDPSFHKTVTKSMQRKAVHYMRAYFNSDEFKRRCEEQAKRMIKDDH